MSQPEPQKIIDPSSSSHKKTVKKLPTPLNTNASSCIYTQSLAFTKNKVSLSAMAFLFQEMVSTIYKNSKTMAEFEAKLNKHGFGIGVRLLELLNFRASLPVTTNSRSSIFPSSSSTSAQNPSNSTVSASGSGAAGGNSGSGSTTDRHSNGPESLTSLINTMKRRDLKILDILQFVHGTVWAYLFDHPSDDLVKSSERSNEYMIVDNMPVFTQFIPGGVSCDFYVCGIVQGFLTNAGFPCRVTPHRMPQDGFDRRIVYLVQFDKQVLEREGLRFGSN
ncbi:hypothetical protein TBLA_0E02710 [Henningerozyma blattae CBS 6284]|uniref:Trafficking protein particle complex subunit n=1 Tax=Henningerozyma blattae (strain ATCC 34711 / CBS 6284 / DSM 70876 / NBRC 10599 / NRRL Y-10934 / UCD 77-7) TaxID=1071380 RepID=I2H4M5_HENB6|nr:hypothetical protein TBLA_0E02710 [Tetrapisispora blattae CBS 6284]CCH61327.1 hypothetical protein TBLA_0E02710 [Tetrapisispora blattae CBS 6284]